MNQQDDNKGTSNKIAIFLAEIPQLVYTIGFLVGNGAIIYLNVIPLIRSYQRLGFINGWFVASAILEIIIEAGLLSIAIVVVIGLIIKLIKRKK